MYIKRIFCTVSLGACSLLAAADHQLGEFTISESTGAIVAGGGVLQNCRDGYALATRDGDFSASEASDRVTGVETAGDELTLFCENDETQLNIVKRYRCRAGVLEKNVEFTGPEGFVTLTTSVRVAAPFRRDAYYHKPVWHSTDPARIPARSVSRPLRLSGAISMVSLVNPERDETLAVYRSAVDGVPVFPYGGVGYDGGLTLNRNGWDIETALLAVRPDEPASVSVTYELRQGDEFAFYYDWLRRDTALELQGDAPEGWPERILAEGAWDAGGFRHLDRLAELSRRLPWNTVYAWTLWGWFAPYYGDYASRMEDAAEGTVDPAEIRAGLDRVRQALPHDNVKLGCYILPGAINRSSRAARENPEWLVYDRNGTAVAGCYADYAPDDPTFSYSIRRGALEHWRDRIEGVMRDLGADYLYIDGGIAGAVLPDWRSMSVDQDYHWYELWRSFQQIAQEYGGMLWSNQSAAVFTDGGYHEFNWYPSYAGDWRTYADRVLTAVMFRGPGRPLGLVGYVWNGALDNPATRLQINSYFVHGTSGSFLDVKGADQIPAILAQLPYLMAAYELSGGELVPARVRPDWRDEDNELEVHAFRFPSGAGGRLGLLAHRDLSQEPTEVSVAVADLGLKPDQPLYVWRARMKAAPGPEKLAGPAEVGGVFELSLLAAGIPAPEVYVMEITPEKETAELLLLTASPALFTVLDGQELPLPLPEALGAAVAGVTDASSGMIHLQVDSREFAGEVTVVAPDWLAEAPAAAIQPQDGGAATVAPGPRPLEVRESDLGGRRVLKLDFPAGRHHITIRNPQD